MTNHARPETTHDWPLGIRVDAIDAMLNFEIVDHPIYHGLEIQYFDDPAHGTGMLVMLVRSADGKVDVYRQPGVTVEPASYGINAGLGEWLETTIEPAQLTPGPFGVHADVRFRDSGGRLIEVHVDDRAGRARRPATLLAPFGSTIERPVALLLVWMRRFDLVRAVGQPPVIRIDDRPVTIGRLPAKRLHRRHLIKYASDLWAVEVNPDRGGVQGGTGQAATAPDGPALVAQLPGDTAPRARLTFDRPVPRPGELAPGQTVRGTWTVGIDDVAVVTGGTWTVSTSADTTELVLDVTLPWRPRRLPLLMRIVTTLAPVFRRWPTTYRWVARSTPGDPSTVTAQWERTTTGRDASYRRISR